MFKKVNFPESLLQNTIRAWKYFEIKNPEMLWTFSKQSDSLPDIFLCTCFFANGRQHNFCCDNFPMSHTAFGYFRNWAMHVNSTHSFKKHLLCSTENILFYMDLSCIKILILPATFCTHILICAHLSRKLYVWVYLFFFSFLLLIWVLKKFIIPTVTWLQTI